MATTVTSILLVIDAWSLVIWSSRIDDFFLFGANLLSRPDALVAFDNHRIAFSHITDSGDPGALCRAERDRHGADGGLVAGRSGNKDDRRRATEYHGVFRHKDARRRLADSERHAGQHAGLQ